MDEGQDSQDQPVVPVAAAGTGTAGGTVDATMDDDADAEPDLWIPGEFGAPTAAFVTDPGLSSFLPGLALGSTLRSGAAVNRSACSCS